MLTFGVAVPTTPSPLTTQALFAQQQVPLPMKEGKGPLSRGDRKSWKIRQLA